MCGKEERFCLKKTEPGLILLWQANFRSINEPARSLGPAIVFNYYKGIWIYIVGPIAGAIAGAWFYNIIRLTDKPFSEILSIRCFLRNSARLDSKQLGI
ncbi:UNVERIFIED_CONTAM: Aquaporin NIP1-1 [Sesamum angustifolium]|uniref:Aquaporin NIP1-1 n=1 Tax=Sesamum angustifolium TaxID=2727405 RepID=A0AAW2PDU9_9LAMI